MDQSEIKKCDVVVDLHYLLEYMDMQYKKKIEDNVLRWSPKDYKYIFENNFDHYLLERLIEVLDIENTIKELSNKNTKNNEKIKALDEIKNNFHKIRKEALNKKMIQIKCLYI